MIRHAPSIGIGLGLSLRGSGFGVGYPTSNLVLDLSSFNYSSVEVPDISPGG